MQLASKTPHIHEVVVNTSPFDESNLRIGDERVHVRGEAVGKHLSDDLRNGVDKAYRSIVRDPFCSLLLGEKYHVRQVKPLEVGRVEGVETVDDIHQVHFDDGPTVLEEDASETVRPRSLPE